MNYKRLYIPNALIFITVVTHDRKEILLENIEYLRDAFKTAKKKYLFEIIAIIVNKDHFHMIINPAKIDLYPKIIGCIKSTFTRLSDLKHAYKNKNRESDIWQRRYWEHSIISENDLYRHIDYIHYNSMKHYNIAPKDWKYSSFHKFVEKGYYDENWCNFNDKYDIISMDLE